MKVHVDNVWSSPSRLHLRVMVCADDYRWRHKYEVSVPLDEIEPDALAPMFAQVAEDQGALADHPVLF